MVKNIWKNTRTTITFGTCAADGDDGIDNTTIINVPITAGYTGNDLLVSNFTITYTTNSRRTITPTSAFYDTTTSIYKLTLPETPT
ncbi:hypothetical protein FACS1894166_04860 [Bacilli bacterium]|nr:hypothetical protein FACS1894166_04860 [Bacilli bacterium]